MSKLLIGNWKMNGSMELLDSFFSVLNSQDYILGLPSIFLCYASKLSPKFALAAQDCSIYPSTGPHTGEVSAHMLKQCGCQYVILGHSERRSFGESIETVRQKLIHATDAGLTPVLCIDEQFDSLLDGPTREIIESTNTILAYEPVSAIGTGQVPSDDEIHSSLSRIKALFSLPKITLYGGSVNAANIESILSITSVDGVLVGGASLKIDEMQKMLKYV